MAQENEAEGSFVWSMWITECIESVLRRAIRQGVPLYNQGLPDSCYRVYVRAAEQALREKLLLSSAAAAPSTEDSSKQQKEARLLLRAAILQASGVVKDDHIIMRQYQEAAWIMRRCFDKILAQSQKQQQEKSNGLLLDTYAGPTNNADSLRTRDRHRKTLVVFGCLSTFLYVGAFFGYGPMQILLEENAHFSSRCSTDDQDAGTICPAQTSALINVQFIAQITSVFSPLLGYIADRFGAPAMGYLLAAFILTGLVLLLIAAKYLVDELLYAAFVFLAFGTWTGSISIVQLGRLYFSGRAQSQVIFGLNALFDSAAITYLGLWGIAELTGASLTVIAACYLGLAVATMGGSSYLWSVVVPIDQDEIAAGDQVVVNKQASEDEMVVAEHAEAAIESAGTGLPTETTADSHNEHNRRLSELDDGYIIVAERTPRQQLTSRPAFLLALFFGIHVTANNWTLTTTRDFLGFLGDDELNNIYLTIFTLATPASLVAVPFVDAIIVRFGFHGGLQSVNVLGLAYMSIRVASDNLNVQVVGFILFSFYRCFLFGVVFSFLPTLVAGDVIGKASGWMYLIAGVTAFLNIPLATVAVENLDGDFFVPNLVYVFLYFPCIAFAWDIGRTIKQEARAKQGTQPPSSHASVED